MFVFLYFQLCGLGVASGVIHVAKFHNIYDLLQEICIPQAYTFPSLYIWLLSLHEPNRYRVLRANVDTSIRE